METRTPEPLDPQFNEQITKVRNITQGLEFPIGLVSNRRGTLFYVVPAKAGFQKESPGWKYERVTNNN